MGESSFQQMTDSELVSALAATNPLASNLSALFIEMWKRDLEEVEKFGLKLMRGNADGNLNRHPDVALYDVLEVMCGCFRGPVGEADWIQLQGYEKRIRDTLMIVAARDDPNFGFKVLASVADDEDHVNIAFESILSTVPDDNQSLQSCLIEWAWHPSLWPRTRLEVLRRLGQLPWSEALEEFFVESYLNDDGSDPAITSAINEALSERRNE